MKKAGTLIAIIITGILSILLAQYFVRKLYKYWDKNHYTELRWDTEPKPWEAYD